MSAYYAEKLAGERLRRCYELAPPRVRQYLEAEIRHVARRLGGRKSVLELGCGYGRVALALARAGFHVTGVDTAEESLELAQRLNDTQPPCEFLLRDARDLGFPGGSFDAVVCVQNGIAAFGVDPLALLREALRVTRTGGLLLFSSYSDRFWPERLAWFEAQSEAGLLGPLDRAATGEGWIVCQDGFRSGRVTPGEFRALADTLGLEIRVSEVDESSVFCETVR
ncbi:MAG: class I SAM-dependent methyltransferase [Planctomycetota bacterium]